MRIAQWIKMLMVAGMVSVLYLNASTTPPEKLETEAVQKVYIYGGKYATKYHSHSNCSGLNNCKGGLYTYDSQNAASNAGFVACKICWK